MKKSSVVLGIVVVAILFISFKVDHHHHKNDEIVGIFSDMNCAFEKQLEWQSSTEILMVSEIEFIALEDDIDLGFDPAIYLPIGFNAYSGMELGAKDLEVLELEEEIDLGFDPAIYLPQGFNAYAR